MIRDKIRAQLKKAESLAEKGHLDQAVELGMTAYGVVKAEIGEKDPLFASSLNVLVSYSVTSSQFAHEFIVIRRHAPSEFQDISRSVVSVP